MKKYLITLNGHGSESVFMKLTPEQYSWWFQASQDEEFELEDYLVDPESFSMTNHIPDDMNLLRIDDDNYQDWDNNDLIFEHYNSPELEFCELTIEELEDDGDYSEILSQTLKSFDEEFECFTDTKFPNKELPEQVLECNSYEKGTLYGAIIEVEEFDPTKLKITVDEAPNGNMFMCTAFYDGEELCCSESSTRGKGMSAQVWER